MNKMNKKNKKKTKKKIITYNLKFIHSARHQNRALSTLVDNLSEISKCKCEENKYENIKIKLKIVNNKKLWLYNVKHVTQKNLN